MRVFKTLEKFTRTRTTFYAESMLMDGSQSPLFEGTRTICLQNGCGMSFCGRGIRRTSEKMGNLLHIVICPLLEVLSKGIMATHNFWGRDDGLP